MATIMSGRGIWLARGDETAMKAGNNSSDGFTADRLYWRRSSGNWSGLRLQGSGTPPEQRWRNRSEGRQQQQRRSATDQVDCDGVDTASGIRSTCSGRSMTHLPRCGGRRVASLNCTDFLGGITASGVLFNLFLRLNN